MKSSELYLLDGVRTPMGEFNQSFADLSAIDLAVLASTALFERSGVLPSAIDHTIVGNALQTSPDAIYGARHVALRSGVPLEKPALTVNRLCGSGIQSIISGAHLILAGEARTCLVGGMESMSQAPHCIWGARRGFGLGQGTLQDLLMVSLMDSYCGYYMAQTSNNLAREYGISRSEQDQFAARSQRLGAEALEAGRLAEEIVEVEVGAGKRRTTVSADEHLRPGTTPETLAKLRPVFDSEGFVTAGNASGIVDGAAMLILAGGDMVEKSGREPLARIRSWAVTGVEPDRMGIGPVPAIRQAAAKSGLELEELDLFEINEAFAGQILAVTKELEIDVEKLNVNGGAIALGHPLGATGSRIVLTLAKELRRRGGGIGVASACIGGGQGIAMILEVASG